MQCGEIVCSNCTLLKNALLPTIGYTRVRVCVTCVFNHAPAPPMAQQQQKMQASAAVAPLIASTSISSPTEEAREWISSHLHSPISKSDEDAYDTEDSYESSENNNNNREQVKVSSRHVERHRSRGKQQQHQMNAAAPSTYETRPASPPTRSPPPSSTWSHPWPKPPVAADEESRLQALYALDMLDSSPEKPFDMICDLAKARLSCPMAAVSFMDEHRQWFKASAGLAHKMIPRKIAFCAYTVFTKEPVVVLDTLKDKRFECNPLVSGAAAVRFYAAAPIIDPSSGHAVGSVFVLDTRPRESCDVAILERLAHAAGENLPRVSTDEDYNQPAPLSLVPSSASTASLSSLPSSAAGSPTSNNTTGKQTSSSSPLSTMLTTTTTAPAAAPTTALSTTTSSNNNGVASSEQMEVLLMRLLTQNTETQQQLATQQISISNTLGFHSTQISKLMTDFARMEAKMEASIK